MYGTQTKINVSVQFPVFENDVKMYGTQTKLSCTHHSIKFENDVKMYGTQTEICTKGWMSSLRMM